jgi:ribosome-associated protein
MMQKSQTTFSIVLFLLVVVSAVFVCHCDAWSNAHRLSQKRKLPTCYNKHHHKLSKSSITTSSLYRIDKSKDMLEFMDEPRDSHEWVGDKTIGTPESDDLAELVRTIVRAADARKAENIVAMRVSKVSTLTSFLVIVTGNSRPQNRAITESVKDDVQELYGMLPGSTGVPEGSPESGWTVLDYGSVMVHVMTPKSRLFYNVEGQWRDKGGEYMNLADVVVPNTVRENVVTAAATMQGIAKENDPFWS